MTQEEKQLLLIDLCARLPYNVRCLHKEDDGENYIDTIIGFDGCRFEIEEQFYDVEDFKLYLRPMSSMTEDEREKCRIERGRDLVGECGCESDYLNSIHIDYRGLIPKGLALEAPEGMYNLNKK